MTETGGPAGPTDQGRGAPVRLHPVLLPFLLVLALTVTPYLVASLRPASTFAFVGAFYYIDDFHNYLSYAQQAEQGAFVFQNRALLEEHPPALVNLEWWLVGRASAALGGGRLVLAYRLFGAAMALAFLVVVDTWLRRLGLGAAHRLGALVLASTGGGLGGLLFELTGRPIPSCLDLYAGLFPFLALAANPHFVAGTTLLLWALHLFDTARGPRATLAALAVANALALVRPYDLVLLVLIRVASVLLLDGPKTWVARLSPLAGLLPVVGYLYWLFYRNPAFSFYAATSYLFPPWSDFLWALGPAAALALWAARPRGDLSEGARRARAHLLAWAAFGALVVAVRPVNFSLQFLVGVGLPFLLVGALELGRRPPRELLAVALLFSTSQIVLFRFLLRPSPHWLVPRQDLALVDAMRPLCRPGDVAFAPPHLGLLIYGHTSCRALLAHPITPGYAERLAELKGFSALSPADRSALLKRYRVSHLLLPGDAGPAPVAWLGPETAFRRRDLAAGSPAWSLYVRDPPAP